MSAVLTSRQVFTLTSFQKITLQPNTHFRVTLRRSGIFLGKRVQGNLAAIGLRRRMQTVYHLHTPEAASMILPVKKFVEVESVLVNAVQMAGQQRAERKAPRGLGHCAWLRS
ncbi:hypothetical protein H4582DRAFT_1978601 [Lactarius indigo]|nr:hypothetical protein H4582DRAFT_1978601 [Lactarius indigo]